MLIPNVCESDVCIYSYTKIHLQLQPNFQGHTAGESFYPIPLTQSEGKDWTWIRSKDKQQAMNERQETQLKYEIYFLWLLCIQICSFTHSKLHKIHKRMASDWTYNSPSKNSLSATPTPCKPMLIMLFKQLGRSKGYMCFSKGHKALNGLTEHYMKTIFLKNKSH